jgi:hypothetical protein
LSPNDFIFDNFFINALLPSSLKTFGAMPLEAKNDNNYPGTSYNVSFANKAG